MNEETVCVPKAEISGEHCVSGLEPRSDFSHVQEMGENKAPSKISPRASQHRIDNTPVYVLHRHPYSESSLILELFSREHGSLPVLAKGAKRPNSALRSTLMLFQPLLASYSGKHEVRTLLRAEWCGGLTPLPAATLLSAYYLNELLLKLLPRDDPHPALFDAYAQSLQALSDGQASASVLRRFEKTLLRDIGYDLTFDSDTEGEVIEAQHYYRVHHEYGATLSTVDDHEAWSGEVLLAIAQDNFTEPTLQQATRNLMRMLLNHHLDGRRLKTRQVLLDLQSYD